MYFSPNKSVQDIPFAQKYVMCDLCTKNVMGVPFASKVCSTVTLHHKCAMWLFHYEWVGLYFAPEVCKMCIVPQQVTGYVFLQNCIGHAFCTKIVQGLELGPKCTVPSNKLSTPYLYNVFSLCLALMYMGKNKL